MFDPATSLQAYTSIAKVKEAFTPEDPDRGNLTPRILSAVGSLVAAMGGRYPRVHHNAEVAGLKSQA